MGSGWFLELKSKCILLLSATLKTEVTDDDKGCCQEYSRRGKAVLTTLPAPAYVAKPFFQMTE